MSPEYVPFEVTAGGVGETGVAGGPPDPPQAEIRIELTRIARVGRIVLKADWPPEARREAPKPACLSSTHALNERERVKCRGWESNPHVAFATRDFKSGRTQRQDTRWNKFAQ